MQGMMIAPAGRHGLVEHLPPKQMLQHPNLGTPSPLRASKISLSATSSPHFRCPENRGRLLLLNLRSHDESASNQGDPTSQPLDVSSVGVEPQPPTPVTLEAELSPGEVRLAFQQWLCPGAPALLDDGPLQISWQGSTGHWSVGDGAATFILDEATGIFRAVTSDAGRAVVFARRAGSPCLETDEGFSADEPGGIRRALLPATWRF